MICWNCGSDEFTLAGEFGYVCARCGEQYADEGIMRDNTDELYERNRDTTVGGAEF